MAGIISNSYLSFVVIFISNFTGFALASSITLTVNPSVVREGSSLSLSCVTSSSDLLEVVWMRNDAVVFNTRYLENMPTPGTSNIYRWSVEQIRTSPSSHNVTISISSTLDDGYVWRCGSGGEFSNSVTIHVLPSTTVNTYGSSTTTVAAKEESDSGAILIVAILVTVIGTVASVVIIFWMCVHRERKIAKKDAAESETQVYSILSHGSDTRNTYSDLKSGLHITPVYYDNAGRHDVYSDVSRFGSTIRGKPYVFQY